jgi:cold shock CspA family protein/uncharacterized LabA/DUF88 family protein
MIFIDGTWLYSNLGKLGEMKGKPDYHIDFGKLPRVLSGEIARALGDSETDVVRTHLFGSYASNCDLRDDDAVQRRLDFYGMLKEEHHYELETFPINFRGRRLRREDREPGDTFEPKEKCVDIALATTMLYLAAIPNAYDVAVCVLGDHDFKPVLQRVRMLGKRVALASIRASCSPDLSDPRDEARVKDFDVIWLEDILDRIELKFEPHQLECQSPTHKGDRLVWTTFHPRKNQRFYCEVCRAEFARQKQEAQQTMVGTSEGTSGGPTVGDLAEDSDAPQMAGFITRKMADRGFGFIRTSSGNDYFFHLSDLVPDADFAQLKENDEVIFTVKKNPIGGKAGAARSVQPIKVAIGANR